MQITEAYNLAVRYMNEHNLGDWTIEIKELPSRFGLCRYRKKKITLSTMMIYFSTEKQVTDVIKHEIAHALVGYSHHHDKVWKHKCIEIGGNGKRCGEYRPLSKYVCDCTGCGKKYSGLMHKWNNAVCRSCGRSSIRYQLTKEFIAYRAWLKNNKELVSSKGQDATPSQVASSF